MELLRTRWTGVAETAFGIPMSHCALAVSRGPRYKYVQFAADASVFPPLLFDLSDDPEQTHNLLVEEGAGGDARPPGRPPRSCCSGRCGRRSGR